MFGQEKYSKEAFEKEEKQLKGDEEILAFSEDQIRKRQDRSGGAETLLSLFCVGLDHEVRERITEAREKLGKMKMAGQKEANSLNEEYDNLCAKTARALEAQHAFEVEKLGMHKDEIKTETETVG